MRLVDGGIWEDISVADAAENVISSPQIDTRLAAGASGGGKVGGENGGGLAAARGDSSVSDFVDILLSALGRKEIASKCELMHNLSSRPDFKAVFSANRADSIVGPLVSSHKERSRADGGDCVHDEHAKRGRFKGITKEECTDEGLSEFFAKMSMKSSSEAAVAVPPEKYLDKCIITAIQHLSTQLDEDATRQLNAAMDEIQLIPKNNISQSIKNKDDAVLAKELASAREIMELGAVLMANSSDNKETAEIVNPKAPEIYSPPILPRRRSDEPIQPFMTDYQEERARMVELFKAVNPAKLAILDELAERRKSCPNGFDQMWLSYKQKWGTEAVERAFSKVRKKKGDFYRAKMVALFAANQPSRLKEVDDLMAKHCGNYDRMFKRWVEIKKFDSREVTDAHNKAMKEVGTYLRYMIRTDSSTKSKN